MIEVKRNKWRARNGQEHGHVSIVRIKGTLPWQRQLICTLKLEDAEQVGRELLRIATEWREERQAPEKI